MERDDRGAGGGGRRGLVRQAGTAPHPYGRPPGGPGAAEAAGGYARRERRDVSVEAARRRFGGIDLPASLVGMLTALAMLTLLGGLIGAAIGAIGYQTGL